MISVGRVSNTWTSTADIDCYVLGMGIFVEGANKHLQNFVFIRSIKKHASVISDVLNVGTNAEI